MRCVFITVLFLVLGSSLTYSQANDFEKKMNDFRYSLNAEMDDMPFEQLREMKFSEKTKKKIEKWLKENQEDILKYKKGMLEKHEVSSLTVSPVRYEKLVLEEEVLSLEINELMGWEAAGPVYGLLMVNPYYGVSMLSSMYLARNMRAEELGRFSLMLTMGGSRISTIKTGEDTWNIMLDQYSYVFIVACNIKTGSLKYVGVYRRKKE